MVNLTDLSMENLFKQVSDSSKIDNYKSDKFNEIVGNLQIEKVDSLKSAIADIKKIVEERQFLNNEIFDDIEKIKTDIQNFMLEAGSQITYKEKLELKKKLIEIELIKLEEKLNEWRDVSNLKKELRDKQKEVFEKESRAEMIERIIGE